MTAAVAFVCRGSTGGRLVMVRCDASGCSASVAYSSDEEYSAAGRAGWRRSGERADPDATHRCPSHAAAGGGR